MKRIIIALVAAPLAAQGFLPTLHSFDGNGAALGRAICTMSDMDGDGVPEIAAVRHYHQLVWAGPPCGSSCTYFIETRGVRVFSGRTGTQLFAFDDPTTTGTTSHFEIADAGDLDGDGKSDVAWSADSNVRVLSTQNAAVLRQWSFTSYTVGSMPRVVGIRDGNGDGMRDLAVGEPSPWNSYQGRVSLLSGATGAVIQTIVEPGIGGTQFGAAVVGVDDLNGDTATDIVVGAPYAGTGGQVIAYSGATGSVLWTRASNVVDLHLGTSLAVAGDVNGDGVPDVIAGAPGANSIAGRAYLLSGANGVVLHTFFGSWQTFGTVVGGGYDVNGDGVRDVAIGDPENSPPRFALFNGTGTLLHTYTATNPGYPNALLISPDLNGDGYGEVVASNLSQLHVDAFLGALTYGTPGGTLGLGWVPGAAVPAVGHIAITGGSTMGSGIFAVSESWSPPWGTPPATGLIAVANLVLVQPVTFDANGAWTMPLDLRQPLIAGSSFYLQGAELGPSGASSSNAMQLLFGN